MTQSDTETLLSTLTLCAGFEAISIDFDRGVWVVKVNEISLDQMDLFSLSVQNYELKHVAIEFEENA